MRSRQKNTIQPIYYFKAFSKSDLNPLVSKIVTFSILILESQNYVCLNSGIILLIIRCTDSNKSIYFYLNEPCLNAIIQMVSHTYYKDLCSFMTTSLVLH